MADLVPVIKLKKEWTRSKTVKRILNGGGSLSNELLKDAIKIFPSPKILSAYGISGWANDKEATILRVDMKIMIPCSNKKHKRLKIERFLN